MAEGKGSVEGKYSEQGGTEDPGRVQGRFLVQDRKDVGLHSHRGTFFETCRKKGKGGPPWHPQVSVGTGWGHGVPGHVALDRMCWVGSGRVLTVSLTLNVLWGMHGSP